MGGASEMSEGRNRIDLEGRSAVVTGGAQGIGLAIVERLLESGARVTVWDPDEERMGETMPLLEDLAPEGTSIAFDPVDVTDWSGVEGAAERAARAMGSIDILVNNAGIAGPNAPTWEYPLDAWREVMAIDLDGVFHCCRAVVPYMRLRNYGRIVNIASIAGKEGNPNACAYSAAKAGVIALTKTLGKELAAEDIAVNCVTPAAARTRIFEQMSPSHVEYMLSRIPRGRFVEVREVAALVAWLASQENSFTTGAVFDLSGGRATY